MSIRGAVSSGNRRDQAAGARRVDNGGGDRRLRNLIAAEWIAYELTTRRAMDDYWRREARKDREHNTEHRRRERDRKRLERGRP